MSIRRQETNPEELRIKLLPDEEVMDAFNEFAEAWERHQVAESQLQEFDARVAQPLAVERTFESIESFMEFNRRRREHAQRREELRRNRDDLAERVKQAASVVRVLLPRNCTLIHSRAGSRYAIKNQNGQVIVSSRTTEA